jgi:hypothetical protein
MEWRDADGVTHVIVATRRAAWEYLCRALPENYVNWDNDAKPVVERPSAEAVVWRHDRAKIKCEGCLAVLDGAVVQRVPISIHPEKPDLI